MPGLFSYARGGNMRRLILIIATATLCAVNAGVVRAHLGGEAFILVPLDHVLQEVPFEVIAADVSPDSLISFRIEQDSLVIPLQSATAGPDGHFQTLLTLPASFPDGYSQLIASAEDGTTASTWILVGARTASTPPPPSATSWLADPSVIVLGSLVLGAVLVVAYVLLRRLRPPLAEVRATRRSKLNQKDSQSSLSKGILHRC